MNNLDKINTWYAEKVGAEESTITTYSGFIDCLVEGFMYKDIKYPYRFTIEDARVRELCREKFNVHTIPNFRQKGFYCMYEKSEGRLCAMNVLPTIKEAEIACLTTIYEQRGE